MVSLINTLTYDVLTTALFKKQVFDFASLNMSLPDQQRSMKEDNQNQTLNEDTPFLRGSRISQDTSSLRRRFSISLILNLLLLSMAISGLILAILQTNASIIRVGSVSQVMTPMYPVSYLGGEVHYILPTTKFNGGVCASIASALIHDAEPVVLMSEDRGEIVKNIMDKLYKYYNYLLHHTKPDDIAILLDSFDTHLQRPLHEVIDEFVKSKAIIIFGAEKGCCCSEESPAYRFCTGTPNSPLPMDSYGFSLNRSRYLFPAHMDLVPKHLNSGNIIGYSKDLVKLFHDAIQMHEHDSTVRRFDNDQTVMLYMYWQNRHNISLDYSGQMLKPAFASHDDLVFAPRLRLSQNDKLEPFNSISNRSTVSSRLLNGVIPWLIFEKVTKVWPAFIHYNGPGKDESMYEHFKELWWTGKAGIRVQKRVNDYLRKQEFKLEHKNGEAKNWYRECGSRLAMNEEGIAFLERR